MVSHLFWTPGCFDVRSAQTPLKNMLWLFEAMISSSVFEGTSYSPPLLALSPFFNGIQACGVVTSPCSRIAGSGGGAGWAAHRGCGCAAGGSLPFSPLPLSLLLLPSSLSATFAAREPWAAARHARNVCLLPGGLQRPRGGLPGTSALTALGSPSAPSCLGSKWVCRWFYFCKFWFAFPCFSELDVFTVRYKNMTR